MGVIVKMYVTSIISGTEIFLDNYQKLDNLFKLTLCVIFGP